MNPKLEKSSIIIMIILLSFLGVRIIFSSLPQNIISTMCFASLPISTFNLMTEIINKVQKTKLKSKLLGILSIGIVLLIICCVLVVCNIIIINTQLNDIITIISLLISLPSDFYCYLIEEIGKR